MDSVFPKIAKPKPSIDGFSFQQAHAASREEIIANPDTIDYIREMLMTNLRKQTREIDKKKEDMLRKFFGTTENAQTWGHLFVLEESDVTISTKDDDFGLNSVIYRVEQSCRLRMKTPEELFGPYAEMFMHQNKDWSRETIQD